MKVPTQILNLTRKPFVYIEDPEYIIVYAYMHVIHMGFARAQIANSCNILNLYQIRNLKSYCKSVLYH